MRHPVHGQATVDDFLRCDPEERRLELIRGVLVEKASPSPHHSLVQGSVVGMIRARFARKPGGRWPGGWWFFTELDVRLGEDVLRPDVCGYRRERMPVPPDIRLIDAAPDWVCEVISARARRRDAVEKLQIYFAAGVPHYWLVDPAEGLIEVFRRTELAYALVLSAHRGQRVRAEPFDAVELAMDELLGGDPEDDNVESD